MKKNTCNHKDHELWNRRSFLKGLGLSGLGSMLFANSNITFANNTQLTNAINDVDNDNILLVVKLFGGNDGLNMIVPLDQYDEYANVRPTIKLPERDLISLSDFYAMPNYMKSLEPMWGEGQMKIVHSVGYENQTRSHFKGTDLWASAEVESNIQETGWLGRFYDNTLEDFIFSPPESPVAIEIGSTRNITFDGEDLKYSYSVANIASLQNIAETGRVYSADNIPDCEYGDNVSFLRNTYNNSFTYAEKIHDAYNRSSDYTGGVGGYPASTDNIGNLGESLNLIARLIKGNLGTKVYMVTLNGFDTHSGQSNTHQSLLTNLSECVSYFHEDLTEAGWGDKILTMSQSEFGRRVAENGSRGTDHGAAGPVMLFGESLNGSGFVGEHSKLNDLLRGDLRHTTDFRQIYATVLKNWMCVDPVLVDTFVLGREFKNLELGFQCGGPDITEVEPETEPETIETETATGVGAETNTGTETTTGTGAETNTGAEPATGAGAETATGTGAETNTGTETATGTGAETNTGTETGTITEPTTIVTEPVAGEADIIDTIAEAGVVGESIEEVKENSTLQKVYATYEGNSSIINITSPETEHVSVTLYDLQGKQIAVVENSILFSGKTRINITEKVPGLVSGIYLYRVYSNTRVITKKIMVR